MENARALLNSVESRNSEMLAIMHQYTNYIILILAGIWAFFATSLQNSITRIYINNTNSTNQTTFPSLIINFIFSDPSSVLLIIISISICVLFIWRLYVHYLDDAIAKNYKKIILFEKRLYKNALEIPESSTLFSLVEGIPNLKKYCENNEKTSYDQQSEIIFKLIDKRLIGSRGHFIIDVLVLGLTFLMVAFIALILFSNSLILNDASSFIGALSVCVLYICMPLLILINPCSIVPFIQVEPNEDQLRNIISGQCGVNSNRDFAIKIGLIIILLILIACIFYVIYDYGYKTGFSTAQKEDAQILDEFFHTKFISDYRQQGSKFIDEVVKQSSSEQDTSIKLNMIAFYSTQNFSDPFWINNKESDGSLHWQKFFFNNESDKNYKLIINRTITSPQFWYEKRGNLRLNYISDYSVYKTPEWIASQRTGGCEELSRLLNATANKAGIETRIVRADGAYNSGGHMWNEVKIDGEWKFFDLQQYGLKKNTNDSSYWYGNRSDYAKTILSDSYCDLMKYGVYIVDERQNGYAEPPITTDYDPLNECPHGVRKQ